VSGESAPIRSGQIQCLTSQPASGEKNRVMFAIDHSNDPRGRRGSFDVVATIAVVVIASIVVVPDDEVR
jgi:hypothetical protein